MSEPEQLSESGGVSSPLARGLRIFAHAMIFGLSMILLQNILTTEGVRIWPDQGFGLLVVILSIATSIPALLRTIMLKSVTFGENLTTGLDGQGRLRLLVFTVTWFLFAVALPVFGFLLCATVAIASSMMALGRTRITLAIPVGAIVAMLVFAAFQKVLYVGLPLGQLDLFVINNLLEG